MNMVAINGTVKTEEQNTLTVKPDGGDNPLNPPYQGDCKRCEYQGDYKRSEYQGT